MKRLGLVLILSMWFLNLLYPNLAGLENSALGVNYLVSAQPLLPASLSDPSPSKEREELLVEIKKLQDAMLRKIDWDIQNTSLAFTLVKDYWRAKRWADLFKPFLRSIQNTLSLLAKVTDITSWGQMVNSEFAKARATHEVLSIMMMIQDARKVRQEFHFALSGPDYLSSIEAMLREADATFIPLSGSNDWKRSYRGTIENHLYGVQGVTPIIVTRLSTNSSREKIGTAKGALEVRRSIARSFTDLISKIEGRELPRDFPTGRVISQLRYLRNQVLRSTGFGTEVRYNTSFPVETRLGTVGGLLRLFGHVAGELDKKLKIEERIEVLKLVKSGTHIVQLTIKYKVPGMKESLLTTQSAITIAELSLKYHTNTFKYDPEEKFYLVPQEMVLSMPVELSNLWMIADDIVEHITGLIERPSRQRDTAHIKHPNGWFWPVRTDTTGRHYRGFLKPRPKEEGGGWHLGQDLKAPTKEPVYAIAKGTVLEANSKVPGYGKGGTPGGAVIVLHKTAKGDKFKALYGHLDGIQVSKGAIVEAGQVLGYINDFVPSHLHFGIHPGDTFPPKSNPFLGYTRDIKETHGWVNPLKFLNENQPEGPALSSTAIIIDVSGSMSDHWRGGIKIDSAKTAASQLLDLIVREMEALGIKHEVGVVSFSDSARVELPITDEILQAKEVISRLYSDGRTNIGSSLEVAIGQLSKVEAKKKIIVLLSDGKSNTGLTPEEIIEGPVKKAKEDGLTIFTIGFGEPHDLDEDLLKRIAAETGGSYSYARGGYELENVYLTLRHKAVGSILAQLTGEISQGETKDAGKVQVPPRTGQLHITLNWGGSLLELILKDPRGRIVDETYAGVKIFKEKPVYIIVENPLSGDWVPQVYGRDVPEEKLAYDLVVSGREREGEPILGLIVLVGMLIIVIITTTYILRRKPIAKIFIKYCHHCGRELELSYKYCSSCGRRVA